MKKAVVGLLACLAVWARGEEYRVFTDTQGRAIEAKIVDFDDRKGQIKIERADGMRIWAPPGIFAQDDQTYIKEWIDANRILSDSNLRITLKKHKEGRSGSRESLLESENTFFEVLFNNSTDGVIDGLRVEYKYFIERRGCGGHKGDINRTVAGHFELGKIAPRERKTVKTDPTKLETTYHEESETSLGSNYRASYSIYYIKDTEENLDGIWLRIYGPEVGGERVYRDVSYPKDLKDKKRWDG